MKLGKRREDDDATGKPAAGADAAARRRASVADSWTKPATGDGAPSPPARPPAATPEKPEPETARDAAAEPVVEGEAVELTAEDRPTPAFAPPVPAPMPVPVAEEPVSVVTPGGAESPVADLGDAGPAYASGHAPTPVPGPSWQEPIADLVNERPEIAVGAAFAGGILAALILRRLGH